MALRTKKFIKQTGVLATLLCVPTLSIFLINSLSPNSTDTPTQVLPAEEEPPIVSIVQTRESSSAPPSDEDEATSITESLDKGDNNSENKAPTISGQSAPTESPSQPIPTPTIYRNQQVIAQAESSLREIEAIINDLQKEGEEIMQRNPLSINNLSDYFYALTNNHQPFIEQELNAIRNTLLQQINLPTGPNAPVQNEEIQKLIDAANNLSARVSLLQEYFQERVALEIARFNSGGVVIDKYEDTYPYRDRCPQENLMFFTQWGYGCQGTSYAGWKAYEKWGVEISGWGNAYSWDDVARELGYRVEYENPAPYTIAVSNLGSWGHVMWVESVNSNGTINLTEYNNSGSSSSGSEGSFGVRSGVPVTGLYFIYLE